MELLLIALSARMLADLAGREALAFDLFGDRDLRASRSVKGAGLRELVDAAVREPPGEVVYGASFENHPALVARLAARHTLLGNPPDVLRAVRDPARLGATLCDAGFAFPAFAERGLLKPLRGGGGLRVRDFGGGRVPKGFYVQERIDGLPCSVAAVGDRVLGITEQLVGEPAFGVRGYRWCGNLTPPRLPASEREALLDQASAICSHLAAAFTLRGPFGVDFIWDGSRAWTTEVNPRPTASLELFAGGLTGKAVVFATEAVTAGELIGVRDVPHTGERIAAGRPICTVVSAAATPEEAFASLCEQAARLQAVPV